MQQSKERILHDNQEAWDGLIQLLQRVPQERIVQPNAVGEWSIKDVLGHIATWGAEVTKEVQQLVEGGPSITRPPGFNDRKAADEGTQAKETIQPTS